MIEVDGETSAGEYAPIVVPHRVQVVGDAALPAPRPSSFEELASGQQDSQFVEVRGVVRRAYFDETAQYNVLEIATGGGRFTAYARGLTVVQLEELVDDTVRVRGVCLTKFTRQRQLFLVWLLLPSGADLTVEQPAMGDRLCRADPKHREFAAVHTWLNTLATG